MLERVEPMELSDSALQEFRSRCLQASINGYTIAHADLYTAALAAEVGQEIVPEGLEKGSADHLLALATEALEGRAGGAKKPKKSKAEASKEKKKEPEAKKADAPPPTVKEPEVKKEEVPPPAPKDSEKKEASKEADGKKPPRDV